MTDKLQGIWKTKSKTVGGKSVDERNFDTITVEGRIADVASSGLGGSYGMLTLDPATTPQTFEICPGMAIICMNSLGAINLMRPVDANIG